MKDEEKKTSDSDWVRLQRLEADRRAWEWARLKSLGGWIGGAMTLLFAGIGALDKVADWLTRK